MIRIQVRHRERIYHPFAQLLYDLVQAAYIVECNRYLCRCDYLRSDSLLVCVQCKLLLPRSLDKAGVFVIMLVVVGLVSVEDRMKPGFYCCGFLLRFLLGFGIGVEVGDNLSGEKEGDNGLRGGQYVGNGPFS